MEFRLACLKNLDRVLAFMREYYALDGPAFHPAVAFIEQEAAGLGVYALHLEVERGNTSAPALYRRCGFQDNDRELLTRRLG